jgi:hypothetical protein
MEITSLLPELKVRHMGTYRRDKLIAGFDGERFDFAKERPSFTAPHTVHCLTDTILGRVPAVQRSIQNGGH